MQENTEKTVSSFEKAFNELSAGRQAKIRALMMFRCGWRSRSTFYNKLYNVTPITPPEKAVIALLFAAEGVDAWSGEELRELKAETR